MNQNARRQIKDIQSRAERLLNERPSIDDLEEFHQYNEELKKYLLDNLEDPDLLERVRQIPEILEESDSQVVARGMFTAFLMMFASGIITYFNDRQRTENAMELIREARGKYATIEFLTRNTQ